MRNLLAVLWLAALWPGITVADGPETGVVTGKVANAHGEALPGVTVTIEGPRSRQPLGA
jgi:hypothetical protein